MELINELKLSGQIIKVYPLKYTLAQLPVASFILEHKSQQTESGNKYEVKCQIYCMIMNAKKIMELEPLQKFVYVTGFLGQNSKSQIVLHINQIKFLNKGI